MVDCIAVQFDTSDFCFYYWFVLHRDEEHRRKEKEKHQVELRKPIPAPRTKPRQSRSFYSTTAADAAINIHLNVTLAGGLGVCTLLHAYPFYKCYRVGLNQCSSH